MLVDGEIVQSTKYWVFKTNKRFPKIKLKIKIYDM